MERAELQHLGDVGAREARLVIMVGGEMAAFERTKPLFELMGKNIILQGGPGAGQHCKMANQISIASIMMSWCEALTYAKKAGLDPARVIESIGGGAAASWSLNNLAPRALPPRTPGDTALSFCWFEVGEGSIDLVVSEPVRDSLRRDDRPRARGRAAARRRRSSRR